MDGFEGRRRVRLCVRANFSRVDPFTRNPLPAVQVANGKLLVKRSELDRWLAAHPYRSANGVDVGRIVDDVVGGLKRTA
jgi:hypothetical protein